MAKWQGVSLQKKYRGFDSLYLLHFEVQKNRGLIWAIVFPSAMSVAVFQGKESPLSILEPLMSRPDSCDFYFGDVAQLVEQLLCKQKVAGSNPVVSTNWKGCHALS